MSSDTSRIVLPWAFLSGELQRRRAQCDEWCQAMNIPMNFAAGLGYAITTVPYKSDVASHYLGENIASVKFLPKYPLASDWKMLSTWRHPQFQLNLFQLAVIFNNPGAMQYLVRHSFFTDEVNYKDGSGKLINYPLHLAFCVNKDPRELLKDVFEDFPEAPLYKEGTVDLCHLGSTSKAKETPADAPSTSVAAADSQSSSESASETLLLKQVKTVAEDFIRTEAFLNPTTIKLLPLPVRCDVDVACSLLLLVYRKTVGPKAQSSTVDDFEQIFSSLCAQDISESSFVSFLKVIEDEASQEFISDTLYIVVLLVWAVNSTSLGEEAVTRISQFFLRTMKTGRVCLKAAGCLPTDLLLRVMQVVWATGAAVDQSIQNLWMDKTLQNLCTHGVLKIVRGDVFKIWNIRIKYPEWREYFPYPLLERRWDLQMEAQEVLPLSTEDEMSVDSP